MFIGLVNKGQTHSFSTHSNKTNPILYLAVVSGVREGAKSLMVLKPVKCPWVPDSNRGLGKEAATERTLAFTKNLAP